MNIGDVVFVTRKWPPAIGGMETYCVRLTEELSKTRDIELVTLKGKEDGSVPSVISLLQFAYRAASNLMVAQRRIAHFGDMSIWPLALIARLRSRGVKIFISAHGTDVSYPNRGGVLGVLYGLYLKSGARLMAECTVIANSSATAQCCAKYGFKDIAVIPLATDSSPNPNLNSNGSSLLFAGRLKELKGLKWFVDNVLPGLPEEIDLRVAGIEWDKKESLALQSPRVTFLGPLSRTLLDKEYSSALAVILPNVNLPNGEFEGFGLVAPEAAAGGGVVLVSRQGGLVDAVRDGETGFLLSAGVAASWIEKIIEVSRWSTADRLKFIKKSVRTAGEHYSWMRVARDTARLYEDSV